MEITVESIETQALTKAQLVEGRDVKIRTKAPRPGRNPRTGEAIPIEARRVVTFHASHKLKSQVLETEPSQEI